MEWQIPPSERITLRELAKKQAEYAALPIMETREKMWYDLNDAVPGARPPVVIETWTFDRDFLPEDVFQCSSEAGRWVEMWLLRHTRNHELIDDDKVVPDTFDIGWVTEEDEFGVQIGFEEIPDADGVPTGFRFDHPIHNLERDLPKLKPGTYRVDREKTFALQASLGDLLGDILPVVIRAGCHTSTMLTHRVVELMGMQAFFTAMLDQPEAVHQLMAYLRDNALSRMRLVGNRKPADPQQRQPGQFRLQLQLHPQAPPAGLRRRPRQAEGHLGLLQQPGDRRYLTPHVPEFCFPYYKESANPGDWCITAAANRYIPSGTTSANCPT